MAGQQALRAGDFLNSVGVNTHVWEGVNDPAKVVSDMKYLGASTVREAAPSASDSGLLAAYHTMAQAGLKFDLNVLAWDHSGGGGLTTAGLQDYVKGLETFVQQNPGALTSIEGFNELNNWPVNYNGQQQGTDVWGGGGQGSYAPAANAMKDLYTAIKASPILKNIPVYDLTSGNSGADSHALGLDAIAGHADVANAHVYPSGTGSILQELKNEFAGEYPGLPASTPRVITEFGYTTANGISETQKETLTLNGYLDAYKNGVAKSFVYVMADEVDWPGYGLFQSDQSTPHELATGMHNLTSILNDGGSSAKTFSSGTLNYTVAGMPSQGQSMLMQKSSGAFDLALWNDGSGSSQVSVNLGGSYSNVSVYDVVSGTTATQTLHNVNSLSLNLAGHPLIVEVGGGAAPPVTPTPVPPVTPTPVPTPPPVVTPTPSSGDVLDLSLSEDAWSGDAQFTVSVDGKQVGGTMTAHALASSGASQHVKLTGNWGSGAHSVGVTFLNDAYGGTASTDRNLHVDSIAYDGIKYANTTAVLYSNGGQNFQVGGTTKTAPSDPNTLTLHLSEDAYNGDAQFQVSVDGKTISSPDVVQALHSAGTLQDFAFSGFGPGSHDVGVTFLNDAYGGTASTDRNLYVGSIDFGSHHFATNAALMSNGAQHFAVS